MTKKTYIQIIQEERLKIIPPQEEDEHQIWALSSNNQWYFGSSIFNVINLWKKAVNYDA